MKDYNRTHSKFYKATMTEKPKETIDLSANQRKSLNNGFGTDTKPPIEDNR